MQPLTRRLPHSPGDLGPDVQDVQQEQPLRLYEQEGQRTIF